MKTVLRPWLLVPVALVLIARPSVGQDHVGREVQSLPEVRSLVHILDYVAQDYPAAVSGGIVVDEAEFDEMVSFGNDAASLAEALTAAGGLPSPADARGLGDAVQELQASIDRKAIADTVAAQAKRIRSRVLELTGLQTAPRYWPDLASGAANYQQMCAVCHGATGAGDGRVADGLDPRPANFLDGDRSASQSPFQIYNTIRLGVEGTAMPDFQVLNDREMWELAFFVKSLRATHVFGASIGTEPVSPAVAHLTLDEVATRSDTELAASLAERGVEDPDRVVAGLRTRAADEAPDILQTAREYLTESLQSYRTGDMGQARHLALRAYLEGVEPVEQAVRARDKTVATLVEGRMLAVRTAIEGRAHPDAVAQTVEMAASALGQAEKLLNTGDTSLWFSFFVAASILLREGLEALLIIVAILGVLQSIKERRAMRWVHAGWIAAFLVGVLFWLFSDSLLNFDAAHREIMEGGVALLAVGVLLYVGFWLHSKSEIHKWKEFIDARVKRSLGAGNLLGLAGISFFAVFREAFESVLFLSALTLEQGQGHKFAVVGGAVAAIAVVLVVAAALLRFSIRLPIRSLFRYSSIIMGVLCIVLVGKGIHALQEAGLLSITTAPSAMRIDLFGVYPTYESLAMQLILLTLVLLLWTVPRRLGMRLTSA